MKKIVLLMGAMLLLLCLRLSAQTVRYATASDVSSIPNANLGDLLITGGTETSNGLPAVWLGPSSNWPLTAGKKILIKGGVYDFITIYNPSSGASGNPIIITNYGGQVETKALAIKGMKYFKLTGKYDPAKKTGDVNYQGHANGYAWTQGKYGIFVNNKWTSTTNFLIEISGFSSTGNVTTTNYEVEYIESGNGGYSNVFKFNDVTGIVDSVKIHDLYIHDTDGEGTYIGNSATTPQQVFKNVQIYNNRIIRSGNDGLQVNNIVDGSNIYNNVILNSGMSWRNPFMEWQDFGCSLSFNNGNAIFKNNIVVGAGGQLYQSYLTKESTYSPTPSGTVLFTNNLFMYSKNMGVFLGPEGDNLTNVVQDAQSNIFGKFEFLYNQVYTISNGNWVYQSYYNGAMKLSNNKWDGTGGRTVFYTYSYAAPLVNSNNVITTVEDVKFVNYMGDGFNYNKFDKWAATTTVGTSPGSSVTYTPGWYVMHKSKMYKCLQNATKIEPGVTANWSSYWQLMTFNNGASNFPADDVRVPITSTYNAMKMGLLDNPQSTPLPIHWLSFTAAKDRSTVKLNWSADFSDNFVKFVVERNTGSGFVSIGEVVKSSSISYSFLDKAPQKSNQYRIKAVSLGESDCYSEVKYVTFNGKIQPYNVTVYNLMGQMIARNVNVIDIRTSNIRPGIYVLSYDDGSKEKIFIGKN